MFEIIGNTAFWELVGKWVIGITLCNFLFSLFRGFYGLFIASMFGLSTNVTKYGKWAVVTGCTDGIGKAYAFELAKRGMDIVLISRTMSKLKNVADEIEQRYGRQTKIISVDFTSLDIYERIVDELENLEIGILINNVGMFLKYPDYYETMDYKFLHNILACNVSSVTLMSRVVLPGMKERRNGMIINISSLSYLMPAPLSGIYAATKAYMTSLSHSMSVELKNSGVDVQCLSPGYIVSKMSRYREPSFFIPSPEVYVKSSLKSLGVENLTGGYPSHNIQIYLTELFLKCIPLPIGHLIAFTFTNSLRTKYYTNLAAKMENGLKPKSI